MAMCTPIAVRSLRIARLASTSFIAVVSVISKVSRAGSIRCRCSTSRTLSSSAGEANCSGDRFTAIDHSLCPASCHARSCAHARSSTQSPIGRIRPLRSARGMNTSGASRPSSGWCQRSSASAPVAGAPAAGNLGW
ncbi:hypothetical protein G6F24_017472 [Rhizopus arrhizus]|nr:hypothetical protein G6F24_017472 [Rhizopus arrhizus]